MPTPEDEARANPKPPQDARPAAAASAVGAGEIAGNRGGCMNIEIIHHYPPEILNLLVDTIPLLCRSKNDVLVFFKGAGVPRTITADFSRKLATDRSSVNKYEIVRDVLVRLNDRGEASLRERREILKRVIEFEDFSTCWPDDLLKAKGLVAEIRRVVDVKDSFGRMRLEQEAERKKRLEEEKRKLAAQNATKSKLEQVKKDLYALFRLADPQKRGKQVETCSTGYSRQRAYWCAKHSLGWHRPARASSSKSTV